MELCYRSSVNAWECDENDHMNVRFYVAKHVETLRSWLLANNLEGGDVSSMITVQHIRFQRESRLSAPLSGFACLLPSGTEIYTELRQSITGEVLSSCIHTWAARLALEPVALPEHGAPRGVAAQV